MNPPKPARRLVVGLFAVVVMVPIALVVVLGEGPGSTFFSNRAPVPDPTPTLRGLTPEQAGRAFLASYVDPDGRVVRRDQDGDTVSEGQAYAMLVAVALDDRAIFNTVWSWTRRNLLRPDQTLSWQWRDGAVIDASSASDADLDAARALVLAGQAFGDAELTAAGIRLGQAILDVETAPTPLGRILVAGSWARQEPYAYNPSYPSPVAFAVLHKVSGDPRWVELAAGSHAATKAFLDRDPLPPDWAEVDGRGEIRATSGAAGHSNEGVRYSYDAARMPLRFAESCSGDDVALAARLSAPLSRAPQHAAARTLDGEPIGTDASVVALAGLAAVYAASGDPEGSAAALVAAEHVQQERPSYYGAAWNALGQLLLTDPTLGGCPPLT